MADGEIVTTTRVGLDVDDAFRVFTDGIDQWWRRDRPRPDAVVRFEGDRLVSIANDGAELIAEVAQWTPPSLVELRWYGPHARGGDIVRIEFAADGAGTRVTVRHRQDDSPKGGSGVPGLLWAELLRRLAASYPKSGNEQR